MLSIDSRSCIAGSSGLRFISHWRHGVTKNKSTEEEEEEEEEEGDAFSSSGQRPRCGVAGELTAHRACVLSGHYYYYYYYYHPFFCFADVFVYPAPARDQGHCVTQLREREGKREEAGSREGVAMETG